MSYVRLSPSQVQQHLSCPKWRHYVKDLRWRSTMTPVNLVFGRVIDTVISEALVLSAKRLPVNRMAASFAARWKEATEGKLIQYTNKSFGPKDMLAMGTALSEAFMPAWKDSGYTVALLPDGEPAVQVELDADLGNKVGYKVILDLLAYDSQGDIGILDIKTAAASAMEGFDGQAPQLLDYQWMVDANAPKLGLRPGDVRWMGFVELLKKKKTPEVVFRKPGLRHGQEAIDDRLRDIHSVADEIRAGHHPRRPGMAFSSPCRICPFVKNCFYGSMEGIETTPVGKEIPADLPDMDAFKFYDAA